MEVGSTLECQQPVLDMGCDMTKAILLPDTQLWADLQPACIVVNGKVDLWHHGDIRWHEKSERDGQPDHLGRDYVTYCWDFHLRRVLMVLELMGEGRSIIRWRPRVQDST